MKVNWLFVLGWALAGGIFIAGLIMLLQNVEGVLAFWAMLDPCYGWSEPRPCMLI
jgi:hypothetical protein